YATGYFGFSLQNFSIMVWPVLLANQRTHWPVAHGYEASLLIPGIVDQAIAVGRFLPIIDLVAGDACLEDQVRIAPDRVERVILYRCQTLHRARHVGWREMVERQETPRLFSRNRRVYLPIGGASLQAMCFGPIMLDVDDRRLGVMRLAKQGVDILQHLCTAISRLNKTFLNIDHQQRGIFTHG